MGNFSHLTDSNADHYVFIGYDGEAVLRLHGDLDELSKLVGGLVTLVYGPTLGDGTQLVLFANDDGIADCRPNREVVPIEMSGAPMCLDGVRRICGPMVVARVDEDGKTLGFDRACASAAFDRISRVGSIDLVSLSSLLNHVVESLNSGWTPVYKTDNRSSFPTHQPLLQELDLDHHPSL